MNDLLIRREKKEDFQKTEIMIRDAFWDKYSPGCIEHLLVHRLRNHLDLVPELSFVAEYKGEVVGGIWYEKGAIRAAGGDVPVLVMGPIGVRPDLQGIGIGGELLRYTLNLASKMEYPAVVIYGNPAYYGRFGFLPASSFGVTDSEGNECPALLLVPFGDVPSGAFDEGDVNRIEAEDARIYDRQFEHRQRHIRSSQLCFVPPCSKPEDPDLAKSWEIRNRASELLRKSGIIEAWESIGAKIRLVGSYRIGLMTDFDIDLHIYTETLDPAESLRTLSGILGGMDIVRYTYINGADTDEHCLEWHLSMRDDSGAVWTIDMIQILAGSRYDGVFEDTAESVMDALTPETAKTILQLKNLASPDNRICGVEFYCAVISDGVRTWDEFQKWHEAHRGKSLMAWRP